MLDSILHELIQKNGPITQSQFMEYALQHPEYGYYRTNLAVSKDFITAPEICQVFGELIGAWATDIYHQLNEPTKLSVIELGPGKGTLITDFLRVINSISKSFFKAIDLTLVEINPHLKDLQKSYIQHLVNWVDRIEDIPESQHPIIMIANEFFDALPTANYKRQDNKLYERHVSVANKKFHFIYRYLRNDQGPNTIWEESSATKKIMEQICHILLKQSGVFLCIDYGYESGSGDTLQAIYHGEPSDPLDHIGNSDLTCHVNFAHLKSIAQRKGLGVMGPISQRDFLKNMGLDMRVNVLKRTNPEHAASLEAAVTRLTNPLQMGTIFNVIAVFSPHTIKPAGF